MSFEQQDQAREFERLAVGMSPFFDDGTLGLVWADDHLRLMRAIGLTVPDEWVGQELGICFPVFVGYESDFAAVRSGASKRLDIANVSMPEIKGLGDRIHLSVRWSTEQDAFLILIARALGRADLDIELQRQFRARRLAEMELVEQAESVHATNAVLAEVNRDLAEFTHVVSHDLKAPMRAMRYFVDDLEASLEDRETDADATRAHLARLRSQSRRMTAMLSSLLSYAKLDRKQDAIERIDSRSLINGILASLPVPANIGITIIGEWPTIETAPALLDLVLRNLLDNAIRYAQPSNQAVVVSGFINGGSWEFCVSDNGPGIPENAREAVFNPFTSLEPERVRETEGGEHTGMGLALVRRAVERANASITCIGRADGKQGACFKVTWPFSVTPQALSF